MSRRPPLRIMAVLVLALAAAGGVWWWQAARRADVIRNQIQPVPDLRGRPAELRAQIEEAHRDAQGGSVQGLAELSRLYHANGYLTEATAAYSLLERLPPEEPRWLHRHAVILAGYGETEPALARWRRVVALAPDYTPGRLRLADLLLKSNQFAAAASAYEEILRRTPAEPHAQLGLARLDVEAGRWPQARERLEKLVAQTRYALGYDLIVTVYEHLGLSEQAAAVRRQSKASGAYRDPADPWMDELLDVCFDPYQLALAAGVSHRGGDSARAVRLLERAVALSGGDATIRFQLAGIHADTGDRQRARAELERCTRDQPAFADAWAHLAALTEAAGEQVKAEQLVAAGLKRVPDSPGLHLMRGRYERRAGRTVNAIAAYRRSIELRPNEADAYVELATILVQVGNGNDALTHLEQALAVEPDHPMALSLLALASISNGDEAAARRWLARVKAQPRISAQQAEQLFAAYRGQFGREFK